MSKKPDYCYFAFGSNQWQHVAKRGFILNAVLTAALGIITWNLQLAGLAFVGLNGYMTYKLYEDQKKVWAATEEKKA